jgi:hypothetical protein
MTSKISYHEEFLREAMHLALAMASHRYTPASVREFFRAKKTRSNTYSHFVGSTLKPSIKKDFLKRLSCEIKSIINISKKAKSNNPKGIDERIDTLVKQLNPDVFLITTHDDEQFFTEKGRVEHRQQAIFSTHFKGSTPEEININVVFNRKKEFDFFFSLLSKNDLITTDNNVFFKPSHTLDLSVCKTECFSQSIVQQFPTNKVEVYSELLDELSLL